MLVYLSAIGCAFLLSAGQLLFKVSAQRLSVTTIFDPIFLGLFASALALYGLMSVAWMVLLQHLELSRAYPILALSFVLVPIGEMIVFKTPIPAHYFGGSLLIIAGIAYIALAGNSGTAG